MCPCGVKLFEFSGRFCDSLLSLGWMGYACPCCACLQFSAASYNPQQHVISFLILNSHSKNPSPQDFLLVRVFLGLHWPPLQWRWDAKTFSSSYSCSKIFRGVGSLMLSCWLLWYITWIVLFISLMLLSLSKKCYFSLSCDLFLSYWLFLHSFSGQVFLSLTAGEVSLQLYLFLSGVCPKTWNQLPCIWCCL